ncbi:hypothetical protein [Rubrivirga marina]|uniref:Uncharacterized protein n=1 Tax=Rubrivirga marina TaxID=1196024 RepID=A0A271IVC0_9BACT|nr:hypothetical protein [Rubrivirga marina]PAP75067.1 hypothetical protein BSZ37_00680 [Rubrivirga marina]
MSDTPAAPVLDTPRSRGGWRRGARWFGAEFLVVVTGVLVALAVGAWWQGCQDAAREMVAHGSVGVAALLLAQALTGFSAGAAWGAGVFELAVAARCPRRLRQPSAGDVT